MIFAVGLLQSGRFDAGTAPKRKTYAIQVYKIQDYQGLYQVGYACCGFTVWLYCVGMHITYLRNGNWQRWFFI